MPSVAALTCRFGRWQVASITSSNRLLPDRFSADRITSRVA